MKTPTRIIALLWKIATGLFFVVLIGYLIIGFLLPAPKEPEPISLIRGEFGGVYEPYDGRFVGLYVTKIVSDEESRRFVEEWEKLNPGFDRRDLTTLVGFDKPLNAISRIKCIVAIDCRSGKFVRFSEQYYNPTGSLIHSGPSDRKHKPWFEIPKPSIIDELASTFCEQSAY